MAEAAGHGAFWGGFARDPRDPAAAHLRMSDRDRAHLLDALGEAYADGRLDPSEHDQRVEVAQSVRTFGEVPALVDDLVPATEVVRPAAPADLRRRAEDAWRHDLRTSVSGFAGLSTLLVGIWLLTSLAGSGFYFFWPAFPIFFTGLNVVQTLVKREQIVAKKERRLSRAQDREQRRLGRGGS